MMKRIALLLALLTTSCATFSVPADFMTASSASPVPQSTPHKVGSPILTWAGDMAGSTQNAQYVASISGNANAGGDVAFTSTGLKATASPFNIKDSGAVTRFSITTPHGVVTAGGGGSDFRTIIGPLTGSETGNAALWFMDNSTATSSVNVSMYGDGSNIFVNAPAENGIKPIFFSFGGNAGRFKWLSDGTTATYSWEKSVLAVLTQNAATGATVGDFSITAQAAGGTNAGAGLALSGGAHSGASVEDGPVKIKSPFNPGYLSYTFASDANQTWTNTQSNANAVVIQAGVVTATRTITMTRAAADTSCVWIKNLTAQSVIVQYLTGSSVTLATVTSALVCSDGTNAVKVMTGT